MFSTSGICRAFASSLAVVFALSGTCMAAGADENPSGPYVGAGIGQFDVTIDSIEGVGDTLQDLDSDDAAYKLFFGWRFNPYIAVEGDYIDLGTPNGNFDATGSSGQYELDFAGFAAYVVGSLPLGIFELSAKAGYYWHDIDVHVDFDNIGPNNGDVFDSDESAEAFVAGVGAGVTFLEHINTKIEYEYMDVDQVNDAYTLWLTAAWRF